MQNQGTQDKKDPVDKGLESAEKKFGGSMGQNTEKNRGVNEKIVSALLYACIQQLTSSADR